MNATFDKSGLFQLGVETFVWERDYSVFYGMRATFYFSFVASFPINRQAHAIKASPL